MSVVVTFVHALLPVTGIIKNIKIDGELDTNQHATSLRLDPLHFQTFASLAHFHPNSNPIIMGSTLATFLQEVDLSFVVNHLQFSRGYFCLDFLLHLLPITQSIEIVLRLSWMKIYQDILPLTLHII